MKTSLCLPFVCIILGCLEPLPQRPRATIDASLDVTSVPDALAPAAPCELGQRQICRCEDGSQHFATCLETGIFDVCPCPAIACPDGCADLDSDCIKGTCAPGYGCLGSPRHLASCEDGNPCTSQDRCVRGLCVGTPIACADGDLCTSGRCDAGTCLHEGRTNCHDLDSDPENCGAEGVVCPGGPEARCESGHCTRCQVTYQGPSARINPCTIPLVLQCPRMPPNHLIRAEFTGTIGNFGADRYARIAWSDGNVNDPTQGGCLVSEMTCPTERVPCGLPPRCGIELERAGSTALELTRLTPPLTSPAGVFLEFVDATNGCIDRAYIATGATLTLTAIPVEAP
jgi:hypothetical protein